MTGWGTELWDRYNEVMSHVSRGGEELGTVFARFIKERAELERDYAKNMRKLVNKYTDKTTESKKTRETTQARGFRLFLQEMGFQAGQHEIVAETMSNQLQQDVIRKSKEIIKKTKNNIKEAKKISETLNRSYKELDKCKSKYQKSYHEMEDAKGTFMKADGEGIMSRNEISKLKHASETKTAQYEDHRGLYAQQLIKTNRHQDDYYNRELCLVISKLEDIEIERIDFLKSVMKQIVDTELEVAPIINRCRDDMKSIMSSIDHMVDNQQVIEKLKTGENPPADLSFEEIPSGLETKVGTLGRKKSKAKLNKSTEENSLFSKKKELEKQAEDIESEIEKGKKEISALRLMVQSYTNNPKFGDASKFQSELDSAIYNVQVLESDLHALNIQIKDLNSKLEDKKSDTICSPRYSTYISSPNSSANNGTQFVNAPIVINKIDYSPMTRRSSSIQSGSVGYGTTSNCDSDSIENSEKGNMGVDENDFIEDDTTDNDDSHEMTVMAVYDYDGACGESSIPITSGEYLVLVEDDIEGWTKVRRKFNSSNKTLPNEGFVPTAYLQFV